MRELNQKSCGLIAMVVILLPACVFGIRLPDLYVLGFTNSFSPLEVKQGEILTLNFMVGNNGTYCIPEDPWCFEHFGPAYGPWVEAVFIRGCQTGEYILLGTIPFTGFLNPHEVHQGLVDFQIPADCPPGRYQVIIHADYDPENPEGTVCETDEVNNRDSIRVDLTIIHEPVTLYVDDDGPSDPRPNDPMVSDPCEDGAAEHPFDTIQEAIDDAIDGDTIAVAPGTYTENINLLGKNITLTSTGPTNSAIVKNTTIDGTVTFRGTEDPSCTLTGFNINGPITGYDWEIDPAGENHTHATISHCILENIVTGCGQLIYACDGTISHCLIATINYVCLRAPPVPQIVACHGLIENCTMVNMHDGIELSPGGTCTLRNCIFYRSSGMIVPAEATLNISYCRIEGDPYGIVGEGTVNWGPGNIEADPCFADVKTSDGDYHLKSQAGRWDANDGGPTGPLWGWTTDEVTSLCIDAGEPASPIGNEPFPNGGIINMGVYGGTPEASKSYFGKPPCQTIVAGDVNGDCAVDFRDAAIMFYHWLEDAGP